MRLFSITVFGALSCSLACSADPEGASDEGGDSGVDYAMTTGGIDLTPSSSGTGGSGSGGGPNVGVAGGSNACGSLQVSDGCVGEVFEGEGIPLDIQIIFDQSGSMATVVDESTGETRMDAVFRAVEAFVSDSASVGLGVGLSLFGYQPIGATSCDPDDYDSAAVRIATLPENSEALLGSLGAVEPTGETPTASAIEGGCRLSTAHRSENPGRAVVNLLVTDGEPKAPVTSKSTDCNPTLAEAVAAARACRDDGDGIPTYVLGVGPSLDNLDQIAAAGGTERAYLVADDSSSGVLEALNRVRASATIPCEMPIDASAPNLHFDETSVVTLDQACDLTRLQRVESAASCDGGGFYFDDPESPSTILLCESTCGNVKQPGTKLLYAIGCGIEVIK
ncbi:MAG TPA: vWA domain-containing protein [Polyangiaceae bacterium]